MIRIRIFLIGVCFFLLTDLSGQFSSSNLPIIIIETNGQEIPDDPRIIADMKIINNPVDGYYYMDSDKLEYNGKISIEIRGSTSRFFPKKQYSIETQSASGENLNVGLLGMPSENDWILYAPYSDKSLIRNVLAYQLSREMGQYAPRTRFCELVLNGEYNGVYVLTEKIKRDKNRVNIAAMDSASAVRGRYTGGYIYKVDRVNEGCESWKTRFGKMIMQCAYPTCEDLTLTQLNYSISYIDGFEVVLFSDFFDNPRIGYRRYIDVDSFMDFLYINELSKNIDAYRLSTYLYKERDSDGGRLVMGPAWDFNIAFGNANYEGGYTTDTLLAKNNRWYTRLFEDPTFYQEACKRWNHHRSNSLSNYRINTIIDSLANLLSEAQERNFERWDILGNYVSPNYYIGTSYEEEIEYLRQWLVYRVHWLDYYFNYNKSSLMIVNSGLRVLTNPFNDIITLEFNVEKESDVSFKIYDMMGRLVASISPDNYSAGMHKKSFGLGQAEAPNLKKGFYVLAMYWDGVPISTKKVVRQ